MKAYIVRRINPGSVFRFTFCLAFVAALVACVVLLIMGYGLEDMGIELGTKAETLEVGAGILGAVLASALGGLSAGLGACVLAYLYNIFAAAVGGISVRLDDGD